MKKIFIFTLALLNGFVSFGQNKIILNEEFDNNNLGWHVGYYKKLGNLEIKSGRYIIENFTTSIHVTKQVELNSRNDFFIETYISKLITHDVTDNHGLIWGYVDKINYFCFVINTQTQYYAVLNVIDGSRVYLLNRKYCSKINSGNAANKLSIIKIGEDMAFAINDEIVGTIPYQKFYGDRIGFYISSKIKISVDNLLVMEDESNIGSSSPSAANDKNSEWAGGGSGFFIDNRGYIATNYHVIEESTQIEVNFIRNGQRQKFNAEVIQSDIHNDLAILKITDNSFIPFANIPYNFQITPADVGTNIFALGFPMTNVMGNEIKFTDGKISSKTGIQGDVTTYQISVPIQAGNSGGALFDYDGNLIGITSAGLNREHFQSENVNYAIKSSYLKNLIDVLPISIRIPNDRTIAIKSFTDKIKILSDYVVHIRTK